MDQNVAAALQAAHQVSAQLPMPTNSPGVPAAPVAPGRVRTLDDAIDNSGVVVTEWTKLEATGYVVNGETVKELHGEINLSDVRVGWGVRFNPPSGGTKFMRSYNGVTEARSGRSWADVCQQAQQIDPKCNGQYDLIEIPLTLTEDLKVGSKVYKAGDVLGITPSITGFKPCLAFLKEVRPMYGSTGTVPVIASVEKRTKDGNRPWGIPIFKVRSPAN